MDLEDVLLAAQDRAKDCHIDDQALVRLLGRPTRVESHSVTLGDGWLRSGSPLGSFANSFSEDGRIARGDLFDLADDCATNGGWTRLLIASYAWGTGRTGYGPFRCNGILQKPHIEESLREGVRLANSEGPMNAYHYLNNRTEGHVLGLGPAFFTKFLYFAGRNSPRPHALILDQVLAGAIRTISTNPRLLAGASWRTADYAFYLAYVDHLAQRVGVPTDEIECRIFRTLNN